MEPAVLVSSLARRSNQHGRSAIRSAQLGKRATVRSGQAWMGSPGFARWPKWIRLGHTADADTGPDEDGDDGRGWYGEGGSLSEQQQQQQQALSLAGGHSRRGGKCVRLVTNRAEQSWLTAENGL